MLVKDLSNSFHPYPKPKDMKKKQKEAEIKTINKVSKKHKKLERNRDKNLNKKGKCDNCGKYYKKLDPHEVYGGSNRKRSIQNNFVALLCRNCHNDKTVLKELKEKYQKEFEKEHTREDFIKIIGKSYL